MTNLSTIAGATTAKFRAALADADIPQIERYIEHAEQAKERCQRHGFTDRVGYWQETIGAARNRLRELNAR